MSSRLEAAVAGMRAGIAKRKAAMFALPANRFHHERQKELSRRGIRRHVRPENAAALIAALPEPGDILHAILRGDFILGDALPGIIARTGPCTHLRIATLGLSVANAETLRALLTAGRVARLTLVCSHYFRHVDRLSTFHRVQQILGPIAELKVARCHAKIILIPTERGEALVFEGSANLRSSATVEQLTVFNDPDLLAFHASWIDELPAEPADDPAPDDDPPLEAVDP
jgi:hypothetical protein